MHKVRCERKPTSLKVFKILGDRQGWRCATCKTTLRSTCQVDHITPLAFGGSNEETNLQILCPNCHALKSQAESGYYGKTPVAFVYEEGARALLCQRCKRKLSPYFAEKHKCPRIAT